MPEQRALTATRAAHWLSERGVLVDRRTVGKWVERGILPGHTVGGRTYIDIADLRALLASTPWGGDDEPA